MTEEIKVGNRVRLKSKGIRWSPDNVGCIGTVSGIINDIVRVDFEGGCSVDFQTDWGNVEQLELVSDESSNIPPKSIVHEGYNYTRVGKVVPDWVKVDGFFVNDEKGTINKIGFVGDSFIAFRSQNSDYGSIPLQEIGDNKIRPFENSDYKWGMWVNYKGERAFVTRVYDAGIAISLPHNQYFYVGFSEVGGPWL